MREFFLHGHFYQPPREEPWLELVPREPSAAPDHDWNARITRECYAPLTAGRLVDPLGRLTGLIDVWSHLSFNVGPTLFQWFDHHAPGVGQAIVAADHAARQRTGWGNAMAMPYHHVILPLASHRDKVTEVAWGIRDFRTRFQRDPLGMWLPETAVDDETLAVLADAGIRFTILAPHQVASLPPFGRPGLWRDGERTMAIFCYDGPLSHGVAFGDLLRDADRWLAALRARETATDGRPTLLGIATDGETFGHHHRFGDLTLAALLDRLSRSDDLRLTHPAAVLARSPTLHPVTLVAPTSWSCAHGVERWRADCGCRFDPASSQAWRAPLRQGLDTLAAGIEATVAAAWPPDAGDRDAARLTAGPDLSGAAALPVSARRLLEAERHALAMFTSCGWFFDDLGRIEPRIVLRHAARALDFLPESARGPLEAALLETLATIHSAEAGRGSGADIWHRDVRHDAEGPARLAAGLLAVAALAPDAVGNLSLPAHVWRLVAADRVEIRHRRTGVTTTWQGTLESPGLIASHVTVTATGDQSATRIPVERFPAPTRALLRHHAVPQLLALLLTPAQRAALAAGIVDLHALRPLAFTQAWEGDPEHAPEASARRLHAALDLFALHDEPLPDALQVDAFRRLQHWPPSPARSALAARLALRCPEEP